MTAGSVVNETKMEKNKMSNQSAVTSFHMENFKRRSLYAMVFILLILAFGLITVLNINTGNVHISLSEIIDILLKK